MSNPSGGSGGMDSKTILGIVLCVVFVIAYNQYLSGKYPAPPKSAATTAGPLVSPSAPSDNPTTASGQPAADRLVDGGAVAAPVINKLSPEQLTISTDTSIYRFSQDLAAIGSVTLNHYKSGKGVDATPIELLDSPMELAGIAYGPGVTPEPGQTQSMFKGQWHAERQSRQLRFWTDQGGWEVAQEFQIPDKGYSAKLDIVFTNKSEKQQELTSALRMHEVIVHRPVPKILGILPGAPGEVQSLVSSVNGKATHTDLQTHCDDGAEAAIDVKNDMVDFFGIDSHYFLKVIEPVAKATSLKIQRTHASETSCGIVMIGYQSSGLVQPGESVRMSYATYFGPKDISIMQAYNEHLPSSVDLGFFGFIAKPLLVVIHGFHNFFGNYGVAIIILTILLKVLFYPLMKASAVSMHKMKKLNPQMAEIREKFKDDRVRQQQELMKFMAANKVNPMKGCLPILPQIPVFFAFYQVLRTAIELRHAPFYGWIQDLSVMDPYFVTPVLMGAAMFVQQKLTPTTGMDKTQEKILMFMPIMFSVMMLTLPSGMTLYMLTNTVIGIVQQKWLYRKLDRLNA